MKPMKHPETQSPLLDRLSYFAWVPIPLLLAVIAALWVADLRTGYESRILLLLLNMTFSWLVSLSIGYVAARSFLVSGQAGQVMLGSGSLLWGFTSMSAAALVDPSGNFLVTVHNLGVFGAALCHLVGLLWRGHLPRPGRWLAACYTGVLVILVLIIWTAAVGWTPIFFVQGLGGTLTRQVVLLLAITMFVFSSWVMLTSNKKQPSVFLYWYGLGLALLAVGLVGVMLQSAHGSLLSWAGRISQFLGGVYLLIAALSSAWKTGAWKFSLEDMDAAWRRGTFPGVFKDHLFFELLVRYGLVVMAVTAAMGLRIILESWVGVGLPAYITFYPAVMATALLAGFMPGLVATGLTSYVVGVWILPPTGELSILSRIDRIGMLIFCGMGLFMSIVAGLYQRSRDKVTAYDREVALHESRARLATFAEATFEGIIESEAGRIVDCNEQFARISGYAADELKGMRIVDFITPEDLDRVMANIRGGKESVIEHAMLRKDGTRIIVEAHGRSVLPGSTVRHTAVRDITERKRAEEALRASEERHRVLAETMLQGFVHQDANGKIISMNPAAERILGKSREELLGITSVDTEHDTVRENGESFPGIEHPAMVALRTGLSVRGMIMGIFNPKLNEYRWISIDAVPKCRPDANTPSEVYVIFEDITDRKLTEKKLHESEALYRGIGESIDYGVWVCAPDGRNTYASKSFLEMVGITQEQCSNFGWGNVLHPDDAERTIAAWQECVRTGGKWDIEHRFRGVDGQWHHVLARGVPVKNERGEIVNWAGINLDINRLKQAEEQIIGFARGKRGDAQGNTSSGEE